MASLVERTFITAVQVAESTRQVAKASAASTYSAAGFTPAALTTYIAALLAADVAYSTAVNNAMNTSGLVLLTLGDTGPIPTNTASLTGML
jgi:hypothetical protein